MTTLNSRLQLALLNRKKGRNLLEKGFTLVELMIVIVIVGILSAVALPNFLSQTSKAKATECKSQLAAQLKQIAGEYVSTGNPLEAINTVVGLNEDGDTVLTTTAAEDVTNPDVLSLSSNAGIFSYTTKTPGAQNKAIVITCQAWTPAGGANPITAADYPDASADDGLNGGGMFGCVNLENGLVKISKTLQASGTVVTADKEVSNADGSEVCGTTAVDLTAALLTASAG